MKVSTSLAISDYPGMHTASQTAHTYGNTKSVHQHILPSASRGRSVTRAPADLSLIYPNMQ